MQEQVQEVITFVTPDGFLRLPGKTVLRPVRPELATSKRVVRPPMPSWEEQSICIGASFQLAATNGHDPARRVRFDGFCQSVDFLFDTIEEAVHERLRGEVLYEERKLKSGLHEVILLTVAVPFLFGVPPQLEVLNSAIITGGGIIDRVRHEWLVQPGTAFQ